MRGTTKWFRGSFGFIRGEDGVETFVHESSIIMADGGYRDLTEGDTVEYDVEPSPKKEGKFQAVNVRIIKRAVSAPKVEPVEASETHA